MQPAFSPPASAPAAPRFGRYELLFKLARGGMAQLYVGRLRGLEGFEKLVVIKLIHEEYAAHTAFLKMFIDEARLAARISHPNVVQVLELGEANGSYYIVMEYIHGESLASVVQRMSLPYPLSARIISDAAAGLHAAHELRDINGSLLNVVHRDVSPANILVSYNGAVKVTDFGVARARDNLHVTRVGALKGRYAYMAPEYLETCRVDRRSDVYALGIVLYEITTGQRLYKNTLEDRSQRNKCEIAPPSLFVDDYPEELEAIVMCALQRSPAQRYQTAHELHLALEQFIVGAGAVALSSALGELMVNSFAERMERKRGLLGKAPLVPSRSSSAAGDVGEPAAPSWPSAIAVLEVSGEDQIAPPDAAWPGSSTLREERAVSRAQTGSVVTEWPSGLEIVESSDEKPASSVVLSASAVEILEVSDDEPANDRPSTDTPGADKSDAADAQAASEDEDGADAQPAEEALPADAGGQPDSAMAPWPFGMDLLDLSEGAEQDSVMAALPAGKVQATHRIELARRRVTLLAAAGILLVGAGFALVVYLLLPEPLPDRSSAPPPVSADSSAPDGELVRRDATPPDQSAAEAVRGAPASSQPTSPDEEASEPVEAAVKLQPAGRGRPLSPRGARPERATGSGRSRGRLHLRTPALGPAEASPAAKPARPAADEPTAQPAPPPKAAPPKAAPAPKATAAPKAAPAPKTAPTAKPKAKANDGLFGSPFEER